MKIKYQSDFPKAKTEHLKALRGAQVLPLKGDGRLASIHSRAFYRNSEVQRERLVAARYHDWLESRTTLFPED